MDKTADSVQAKQDSTSKKGFKKPLIKETITQQKPKEVKSGS